SSQTGQGPDAPTTKYAHNALGQRVFKTEPLYAAASSKDGALDDEEEDPGLLQTLAHFFARLWSPAKSDAEHLGWAYVYDEEGSLLGEYGTGGAQSAGQSQYLYLPTSQGPIPIAAEIDGRLYAIHTDHLGTPRRLTQADGQAAWQWAYTPYGDEAPTLGAQRFTNETTNPTTGATNIPPVRFNLRYPGQYFDEESGLHYNYFRSYDPRTGRYTQSDPIGLNGGWNRFSYVGGNPLSGIDPEGLQTSVQWCYQSPANAATCNEAGMLPKPIRIPPPIVFPDDCNKACEKAIVDASNAYWKLTTKRLPQYESGGGSWPRCWSC
ncbi:RHS repeat-associated core domain-containing protein, partial [Simplicispira lacusdiani]|uniref:RHS repeat-associated core domain-containing protein n=1 Tax=Simplicispira lacusdiani TaxID=2213010 RepID=UPI0022B81D00